MMGVQSQNSKVAPASAVGRPARRTSGIVIPHHLNVPKRIGAALVYGLIRTVGGSLRTQWEWHPEAMELKPPVIYAIWHNRLSLSLIMYRAHARRRQQPIRMAAIVSASKDGAVVARILEHFGVQPVRGSSSRRGAQALLELTTWAEQGYDLAITPDGPRGPRYVVQPGAIALGQLTGFSILPVSNHVSWKICFNSWDRFQLPLPLSPAKIKVGQPLQVPRDASDEQRELLRQELERRMRALTVD